MRTVPVRTSLSPGVLHEVPSDIEEALATKSGIAELWNALTPIQRNEWICWTTIVKKPQTRVEHIARLLSDLQNGKRQPCCWPGCPHRRPSAKKYCRKK